MLGLMNPQLHGFGQVVLLSPFGQMPSAHSGGDWAGMADAVTAVLVNDRMVARRQCVYAKAAA